MKVIGYVGDHAQVTEQDARCLTHIHAAFGGLRLDGTIEADHLNILRQLEILRGWNPQLKILISIVPRDPSAFTRCAADPKLREAAAASCADLIQRCRLDGVDFDWEYPCVPSNGQESNPEDKRNFTLFCRAIRARLGDKVLMSIAAGADLYYVESVELPELAKVLDYICVMTYDLKCGFHALTGHHTQLFSSTGDIFRNSCDQALRLFHRAGVPKEQLLLGAAFYSRKWEDIQDRNHGFLQISQKGGGYGPAYGELAESYVNRNGYVRYWDDEAKAPWLFNGSTFLSYDDPESIAFKCRYIKEQGYGGIFYWEHGCDGPERWLLKAIADNR